MADFPRYQWIEVDGRLVPFTEPQHFTGNGDETVRTGHDNPLPVANYTQNDNGIWLPVSKSNPVPTQVTGSKVEDVIIERGVYRSTKNTNFINTGNSKGIILYCLVRAVTGDVKNGGGVKLRLDTGVNGRVIRGAETELFNASTGNLQLTMYPGINRDKDAYNVVYYTSNRYLSISDTLPQQIRVSAQISGEFASNEGVDLEVIGEWLM